MKAKANVLIHINICDFVMCLFLSCDEVTDYDSDSDSIP